MINAAMVGLGRWGQTVLGSIQGKNDRIRIVHGVTKEPELARELAAKHGFRLSTDLKDAIADPAYYERDPGGFQKTIAALDKERAALAALEEEWLELEMLREELEG